MGTAVLCRSGGSLILAVPAAFAAQNRLSAGCQMVWKIEGDALIITPAYKKPTPAELIAETPKEARAEDWDAMPAAGNEQW